MVWKEILSSIFDKFSAKMIAFIYLRGIIIEKPKVIAITRERRECIE